MGRTSRGVKGIKLRSDDRVVGMVVAEPDAFLLTATVNGFGKRTPLVDYPIKGRGGQGVIDIRTTARNGEVVLSKFCREDDDVMFITGSGMVVRSHVTDVSTVGRNTQGVRLVNLKDGDSLVSIEIVSEEDLERFGDEGEDAEKPPETAADLEEPEGGVDDLDEEDDDDEPEDADDTGEEE